MIIIATWLALVVLVASAGYGAYRLGSYLAATHEIRFANYMLRQRRKMIRCTFSYCEFFLSPRRLRRILQNNKHVYEVTVSYNAPATNKCTLSIEDYACLGRSPSVIGAQVFCFRAGPKEAALVLDRPFWGDCYWSHDLLGHCGLRLECLSTDKKVETILIPVLEWDIDQAIRALLDFSMATFLVSSKDPHASVKSILLKSLSRSIDADPRFSDKTDLYRKIESHASEIVTSVGYNASLDEVVAYLRLKRVTIFENPVPETKEVTSPSKA